MTTAYVPRHSLTTDQRAQVERLRARMEAASHVASGRPGFAEFVHNLSELRIALRETREKEAAS